MKLKKFALLASVLFLLSTATVFADDVYGWYKGKKVKVYVNNIELMEPGLSIDGKTMVPLRDVAEPLQAMVSWDDATQTARIYKPNVHMFVFEVVKDKITQSFGKVLKGKYNFIIFTQVDSLYSKAESVKFVIEDPSGTAVTVDEKSIEVQKDNFWYSTPSITFDFKQTGKYTVKMYMKLEKTENYALVSEKAIVSE